MLKKNDDAIRDKTGAVKVIPELNYEFYTVTIPEPDGRCTLHRSHCVRLPGREKRLFLGSFTSAKQASHYVIAHHPSWHLVECVFCLNSGAAFDRSPSPN